MLSIYVHVTIDELGISPRARPHVHSSPPTVTMPADLVDKIYIGYNAPYALGNMLAPQCVPAPIVSPRKYPDRQSASV